MKATSLVLAAAVGVVMAASLFVLPLFFGRVGQLMRPTIDVMAVLVALGFISPVLVVLVLQSVEKRK